MVGKAFDDGIVQVDAVQTVEFVARRKLCQEGDVGRIDGSHHADARHIFGVKGMEEVF